MADSARARLIAELREHALIIGEVTLTSGQTVSGRLREETDAYLVVEPGQGQARRIARSEIARRVNAPSTMPPMHTLLSRREIRDVVEFLTTDRGGNQGGRPAAGAAAPG